MTVAVALRGNLKDFGIADVFQLIGQQRKTGPIIIIRATQKKMMSNPVTSTSVG